VHLHSDDFWHFIKKGAIPPYLPESRKQNEVVMAVLAKASFAQPLKPLLNAAAYGAVIRSLIQNR
jgi:hypothetical protein